MIIAKKKRCLSFMEFWIYTLLFVLMLVTLYPFIYVFSMSISDPQHVIARTVYFLPKGFTLDAYKMVFETPAVITSYGNTIWYTVVGTLINVVMTTLLAYPLSRRDFVFRRQIMVYITLTMFFSGGLVPSFILINQLGIYNTRWAIVLPVAISAYNAIIARTFFESLPVSLTESAYLDGANDLRVFWSIILPLSKPIMAILTLFYAVGHWNSFFSAMLYLNDSELQPLQIYLRRILVQLDAGTIPGGDPSGLQRAMKIEQVKYSAIIVSMLPILCVYPFVQKYFVHGVMIGAIKG